MLRAWERGILGCQPTYEEFSMKFQATVVLELKADSIGEAGQKLDQVLKHSEDEHDIAAKTVELRTPPSDISTAPPVILPPVTTQGRTTGPHADSLSAASRPRAEVNSAG
jgi:hypothetical protein